MPCYDDALTLGAARQRYFDTAGLGDGGYEERWVKLSVGPFRLGFPNAPGRVRAVRLHDLHHVVTGYATTWTGEAEISAWEIASGCAHHVWAWFLNIGGLALGLVIAPRRSFRAFVRGRHCTNLYQLAGEWDESLLAASVGRLRGDLRLAAPPPAAGVGDLLAFARWSALASACGLLLPGLLAGAAWFLP